MKRQIICADCRAKQPAQLPQYNGEYFKEVKGELKQPGLLCDYCNAHLIVGDIVCCQSIGLTSQKDYFSWENKYVNA